MDELEQKLHEILKPVTRDYVGSKATLNESIYMPMFKDRPDKRSDLVEQILEAVEEYVGHPIQKK